ncbi:MAG: TetR/AcrR family transcriptional regulator [Pseudomonadota bacterium]
MAGRKQFDEIAALDAAVAVFWDKGFEAASMAELEAATGLNKSSLYNAYTSKEGLYEACLRRFGDRYSGPLMATLAAPRFHDAIGALFGRLVDRFTDDASPRGCMLTMAAMEAGGPGTTCGALAAESQDKARAAFTARAAQGVRDGDLPAGTDCAALGAMLLAQTRGLAVLNKGAGDAELAREAVRGLMASLPRADGPRRVDEPGA